MAVVHKSMFKACARCATCRDAFGSLMRPCPPSRPARRGGSAHDGPEHRGQHRDEFQSVHRACPRGQQPRFAYGCACGASTSTLSPGAG